MTTAQAEPDIVVEGRRLVEQAAAHGLPVRLIGGLAFWLRAGERARELFGRSYPDIDVVAHRRASRALRQVLEDLGYVPQRTFNAMHGAKRLLYRSSDDTHQLDVFLDIFEMCHRLDLGRRLETEPLTLAAAELLLTKLQIHELNRKDLSDILMMLCDHEIASADGPHLLNVVPIAKLCAEDWGLYTTVSDNLVAADRRVGELVSDTELATLVRRRLADLNQRLTEEPKSVGWNVRARIGRRVRWYALPEEVVR